MASAAEFINATTCHANIIIAVAFAVCPKLVVYNTR
jgi:hypothetical protein